MKKADKDSFISYLRACTNAQVYGVLAKETEGNRPDYAALAKAEIKRRGLHD